MTRTILFATVAALGITSAAHAAETTVKLEGCEYSVLLPDEPAIRKGRPAAEGSPASAPSQVALLRGGVPAFRVECQPLAYIPEGAEKAIFEDMMDTAESMRLTDLRTEASTTRLGPVAKFTGTQEQAGRRFVITGTFFLGKRSMMSVLATEWVETFPSEAVTRVFDSVTR